MNRQLTKKLIAQGNRCPRRSTDTISLYPLLKRASCAAARRVAHECRMEAPKGWQYLITPSYVGGNNSWNVIRISKLSR